MDSNNSCNSNNNINQNNNIINQNNINNDNSESDEYINQLIKNIVCEYSGVNYKNDLIGLCYEYTNQILSFNLISLKSFNQGFRTFDVWVPLFYNQDKDEDKFQDSINNFIEYKSNSKSFSFFLLETCIEIVKRCNNSNNNNSRSNNRYNNNNNNNSNSSSSSSSNCSNCSNCNKISSLSITSPSSSSSSNELFKLFEIYLCFNRFYLKYEYFKKVNIIYLKSIQDLSKQLLLFVGSNNWEHLFKQSVSLLFQRDHNDSFFKQLSLESIQLIMVQYYLLKQISHKSLDELKSISTITQFNQFNNEIKQIKQINNLKEFFNYIDLIPIINCSGSGNGNSSGIYNLSLLELNYIIKSDNNDSNNSSSNNSGEILKINNINIIKVELLNNSNGSSGGSIRGRSDSGNSASSSNESGSGNTSTISIIKHNESEWKKKVQIGKGSFSTVYKAKKANGIINNFKVNNNYCAIKVISKDSFFKDEINILEKLNQLKEFKYFIYYYGYGQDDDNYYIYMEYFSGSSIGNLIKEGNKFMHNDIQLINYELVNALSLIHNNEVMHRDLKCDNILISPSFKESKRSFQVKVIDFGLSKQIDHNNSKYYSKVGTEYFIAPEVKLQNGMGSRKADIWGLGCMLIEMAGGTLVPNKSGVPTIPNDIPDELRNFIQCCLIIDPDKRFNSSQLKLHSYYYSTYNKAVVSRESFFPKNNLLELSSKYIPYIPISLRNLSLDQFDEILEIGTLPNTIIELTLKYNIKLEPLQIPSSVENLTLKSYNQPLSKDCLPPFVRKLKMDSFNSNLEIGSIPSSVVSLSLPQFNQPLHIGIIPKFVQVLELNNLNQKLYENIIPPSVERLNIESMSLEICDGIPESVNHLTVGDFTLYDLPESIETLVSSYPFKSQLKRKDIPSSVVNLVLNNYNLPIQSGLFRKNVAALTLHTIDYQHIESLTNLSEGIFVLSLGSLKYDFEDIKKYLNKSISKLIVNGKTQVTSHDNSKYTRKSRPLNNFFISQIFK